MIQQVVLLFIFTFLKSNTAIPTTTNLEKRTVAGPLVPYGNNEYGFSLSQTWNKAPDRSYISLSFDAFNQANSGQNNGVVVSSRVFTLYILIYHFYSLAFTDDFLHFLLAIRIN